MGAMAAMNATQTPGHNLQSRDATGVPKIDVENVRIKAALKVTGIEPSDVAVELQLEKSSAAKKLHQHAALHNIRDSSRGDAEARTQELILKKQSILVREVLATAETMTDEEAAAVLDASQFVSQETPAKLRKDKEQIEVMQQRSLEQVRRQAQILMNRVVAHGSAAKKREEIEQNLKDHYEEQRVLFEAALEKRNAQRQKVRERIKAGLKAQKENRDVTMASLQKQQERMVTTKKQQREIEAEKVKQQRNRMARIAQQTLENEDQNYQRNVQKVKESFQRRCEVEDRLSSAREDMSEKLNSHRQKFAGKLDKVRCQELSKADEQELKFLEKASKAERAKDVQIEKHKEIALKIHEANEKQKTKWLANRQKIGKDRFERRKTLQSSLEANSKRAENARAKHFQELIFQKSSIRYTIQDLVERNQKRNERSEMNARNQALSKVIQDMSRTDSFSNLKHQLDQQRTAVIKESMTHRLMIEELAKLDPSACQADARRMNEILPQLGLPPWIPASPSKEGEEGQQQ